MAQPADHHLEKELGDSSESGRDKALALHASLTSDEEARSGVVATRGDLLVIHPKVAFTFISARLEARPGNGSSTSGFALGEHLPAVQDERLAGDVSGFVGDEVADCPADLLGLGQSPERD